MMMMMMRLQGAMREGVEEELGAAARRAEEDEGDDPPRALAQAGLWRKCLVCHFHVAAIRDHVAQSCDPASSGSSSIT